MRLKDVKIGDKFNIINGNNPTRVYLRIDIDLKVLFPTITRDSTSFANLVPALDLTTYKINCFNCDYEVEVEYDNVFI